MTAVAFCKFHGFGNDYIVIERGNIDRDLGEFARAICDRHTGAGADGVAALEELDGRAADFFCEIINPDGSIAGFSGNGTRCAVAYLCYKSLWSGQTLRLKTRSGIKNYRLIKTDSPGHYVFEAEVGKPKFASSEIPVDVDPPAETVIAKQLTINNEQLTMSAVNVGNPVACVFVDQFADDWRAVGRAIEAHETFPERANVVFVRVIDRENVEVRIWERGAGETAASGTCSAGAAVLSAFQDKTDRDVDVHSPGGVTRVVWLDDDEIVLTGRADLAYCGEWPG
jgi:diaminopimelate epimerase